MAFKRKQRVAELIKVNLSNLIQRDVAGKLPCMVTIMHVEMSDDLKYAKIMASFYGPEAKRRRSFEMLRREMKGLRKQLGKVLSLRLNPMLTLVEDSSLDNAFRVHKLLTEIQNSENNSGDPTEAN